MARIRPIRPFRDRRRRPDLADAFNLGPKSSAWMQRIGIRALAQVCELGVIEVCRRLRASGAPVSVVMAYALEGALSGCKWNEIPVESRQWLRADFQRMKAAEQEAGRRSG